MTEVQECTVSIDDSLVNVEVVDLPANKSSTPLQTRYSRQIGGRSLATSCSMLFQSAHTILLKNKESFEDNMFCPLADTVDTVLSLSWTTDKHGGPRISYCFRIYQPKYDEKNNRILFGGADQCVFAKDGSYLPFASATGKIFDHTKNTVNYKTFLAMDAAMEAATRSHKLRTAGPIFSDCLLCYKPGELPTTVVTNLIKDPFVKASLELDTLRYLNSGKLDWFAAPDAPVLDIAYDEDTGVTGVAFEDNSIIEVPPAAILMADLEPGLQLLPGYPIASLKLSKPWHMWEMLVKDLGEKTADWLLLKQWYQSKISHKGMVCVPHKYLTNEIAAKCLVADSPDPLTGAPRKLVLRDMKNNLGRDYFNQRKPQEVVDNNQYEAAVNVWNMGGMVSPQRLNFAGPGYSADFFHIKPQWQNYFYANL